MKERYLRLDRWELAGAFGDLGTFIPVAIALVTLCSVNLSSLLVTSGLLYIIAGFYYGIPMPVQPLKVFAAIAIGSSLSSDLISAGAVTTGIILVILAASGIIKLLGKIFPQPVIGGIQFAVGLILIKAAVRLILQDEISPGGPVAHLTVAGMMFPAGIAVALVCSIMLILLNKGTRLPSLIIVLATGIAIGIFYNKDDTFLFREMGPDLRLTFPAAWKSFADSFFLLVLPQLPVTLGNSIVATRDLSLRLFGDRGAKARDRSLAFSLGISNIAIGLLNGMPVCHGCGGLTAHYSFGARTGGATIVLGSIFLLLGIIFGNAALPILAVIPWSVLGVMLFAVGVSQSFLIRELRGWNFLLAFSIGIAGVFSTNVSIPFIAGLIVYYASAGIVKLFSSDR